MMKTRLRPSKIKSKFFLILLTLFVSFLLVGLPGYSFFANKMSATQGKVTFCKTIEKENPLAKQSGYSTYIDVYIGYSYIVKGKTYAAEEYFRENPPDIECKLRKPGKEAIVFFKPNNPRYSTLKNPRNYGAIAFMCVGLLAVFCCVMGIINNP